MFISKKITEEFSSIEAGHPIKDPLFLHFVGKISLATMRLIKASSRNVYISNLALKHIIEQRGNERIIYKIPQILSCPTKIVDNYRKRINSFILVRMNGKANGAVIEITKTPDQNRVVSAFPIDTKTYKKLKDISGRSDVPP